MNVPDTITIAILAGGKSRRMQQDKASLLFNGETLLERTVRIASKTELPIIVVGREQPAGWEAPSAMFMPDDTPANGPLGGLLTALNATTGDALALAADMPLLSPDALFLLLATSDQYPDNDGIVFLKEKEPEPLCAIYRRTAIPIINQRLELGKRSMKGLIDTGNFLLIPLPDILSDALTNINTPEELHNITH